ncbi:hypothetical protein E2C01_030419 [Portunus trituberculatus]|uniref:Uncharacterized protein n=1 Tax=Portunus trituberculatus TaxID=210409 RepID=A0A5B7EUQ6_PORTR|nr:hypothetical protein [Portunus trituberculatus]
MITLLSCGLNFSFSDPLVQRQIGLPPPSAPGNLRHSGLCSSQTIVLDQHEYFRTTFGELCEKGGKARQGRAGKGRAGQGSSLYLSADRNFKDFRGVCSRDHLKVNSVPLPCSHPCPPCLTAPRLSKHHHRYPPCTNTSFPAYTTSPPTTSSPTSTPP